MLQMPKKKNILADNPVRTICLSFISVIMFGAIILFLPISSKSEVTPSFFECLFTATSATCVAGLSLNDTFHTWSIFGQSVIMCLIQVGGLGLITFSSVFSLSLNKKLSLKSMRLANSQINTNDFANISSLFVNVIRVTLLCECIGAAFLSIVFCKKFGLQGIFIAIFSSVSSYCNSGLDINGFISPSCSFIPFRNDIVVVTTLSILTVLGGIGFVVINDLLQLIKSRKKIKFLSFHSKLAIFSTLILIVVGTLTILIMEWSNTLADMSLPEKLSASAFSSITARSAGFSVIDYSQTTTFTKLFTSFLMFIGASPCGTGGGIKTTTMVILIMTTICVIKNCEDTTIFKRKINKNTVYKAISLLFMSLLLITIATIIFYVTNTNIKLIDLFFTIISAFGTVGVSTINVQDLSQISKCILIFLMYIGRVGPLSFALMFGTSSKSKKHVSLPEGKTYVG